MPERLRDCGGVRSKNHKSGLSGQGEGVFFQVQWPGKLRRESRGRFSKRVREKAAKSCDNSRPAITKSKTVSATFDGKAVEGGKNVCASETFRLQQVRAIARGPEGVRKARPKKTKSLDYRIVQAYDPPNLELGLFGVARKRGRPTPLSPCPERERKNLRLAHRDVWLPSMSLFR